MHIGSSITVLGDILDALNCVMCHIVYQEADTFTPISVRNISDYTKLDEFNNYTFVVHPKQTVGFVFYTSELLSSKHKVVPIMRLTILHSQAECKQIHNPRVRESFKRSNIVDVWCSLYKLYCKSDLCYSE